MLFFTVTYSAAISSSRFKIRVVEPRNIKFFTLEFFCIVLIYLVCTNYTVIAIDNEKQRNTLHLKMIKEERRQSISK